MYAEENERARLSFNSKTPVPRLISRQEETERNATLNEKKREKGGEKKPLSPSFGLVIFPAHILTVTVRTSNRGTVETWKGRGGMLRDVQSNLFFSFIWERVEERRVGRGRND